ncbi:hypothetical protein LTR70_008063 [Exophiala xenobiotica]|uniref:Nephrocystin 3-like N-terminal domain-containing protein n=1 Tax=Lithohypha guttulata TaxID=1690604 RepID=A0ABR0K3M6_9EURO|nr:hypothetical protein LTR24_007180 [Lithohypha guttulata]KAK5312620.1 hypothetical protein LTR70_008063 [Exophiala xenobiotica]
MSLKYLSSSYANNFLRGLVSGSVDDFRTALEAALTVFDRVLQKKVHLIILEADEEQKLRELVQWFSPLEFESTQNRLLASICEGTGSWFLESEEIRQFLKGEVSWLWCEGQAGVGKTFLMSLLINTLKIDPDGLHGSSDQGPAILTYIFCDINDQQRQDVDSLLGTIAAQLLQGRSEDLIKRGQYFRERHQHKRPRGSDYLKFIRSAADLFSKIYIVVDALDELSEVREFARHLKLLKDKLADRVCILTMMRPDTRLRKALSLEKANGKVLEIQTKDADLVAYLKTRIDKEPPRLFDLKEELKKDIVDTITSKAESRFILGRLHFESLRLAHLGSPGAVQDALSHLIPDTNGYYDNAIVRIDKQDDVSRLLSWLLGLPKSIDESRYTLWEKIHPTQRQGPLDAQELRHALAIRPGKTGSLKTLQDFMVNMEYLVDNSAGLCVMNRNSGTISFIHPTVQEYLMERKTGLFPNLEVNRCKACIAYLSLKELESGACTTRREWDARIENFPFLEYAARNWCEIQGLTKSSEEVNSQVEDEILQLLSHPGLVANLAQVQAYSYGWMGQDGIRIPQTTGLIIAMQFNLLSVMETMFETGIDIDVNAQNEAGQTALDLAVTADPPYTELLLQHGAEVRTEADATSRRAARDALHIAIRRLRDQGTRGAVIIVKMLMDHDPTVDDRARYEAQSSLASLNEIGARTMSAADQEAMTEDASRLLLLSLRTLDLSSAQGVLFDDWDQPHS